MGAAIINVHIFTSFDILLSNKQDDIVDSSILIKSNISNINNPDVLLTKFTQSKTSSE